MVDCFITYCCHFLSPSPLSKPNLSVLVHTPRSLLSHLSSTTVCPLLLVSSTIIFSSSGNNMCTSFLLEPDWTIKVSLTNGSSAVHEHLHLQTLNWWAQNSKRMTLQTSLGIYEIPCKLGNRPGNKGILIIRGRPYLCFFQGPTLSYQRDQYLAIFGTNIHLQEK